jgi:hypothetical protein
MLHALVKGFQGAIGRQPTSLFTHFPHISPFKVFPHPGLRTMNGHVVQPAQTLERDPDSFLRKSVQELFSLARRTVVITGGGRGIGLAFAFAVAESGANVAVLDVSEDPHPHFHELGKRFPNQIFKVYKYVHTQIPIVSSFQTRPANIPIQNRRHQV